MNWTKVCFFIAASLLTSTGTFATPQDFDEAGFTAALHRYVQDPVQVGDCEVRYTSSLEIINRTPGSIFYYYYWPYSGTFKWGWHTTLTSWFREDLHEDGSSSLIANTYQHHKEATYYWIRAEIKLTKDKDNRLTAAYVKKSSSSDLIPKFPGKFEVDGINDCQIP